MKYVTFQWSIIHGVSDITIHNNKDDALKFFNDNHTRYFELNAPFVATKFPVSYGYPTRKFYGMTKRMFDKQFGDPNE